MSRVTQEEVEEIIDIDTSITDISAFITAANEMVTQFCTGGDMTDAQLKEVERWLSAHFVAIRDMRVSSEKAGAVGQNYQHKLGLSLAVTMYGQQAMLLDFTGELAEWSKEVEKGTSGKTVSIGWMGLS